MKTLRKITKEGIEVTLNGNIITKKYSKLYINMMIFSSNDKAKKEFSKFRQSHKKI